MIRLEDLLALFDASDEEQWAATLFSIGAKCGFEHALFGIVPSKTAPLESAFLRSNYPQDWRATYDKLQLHYVDPTVSHCINSTLPIVWKPATFQGRQQNEFYEQACGYGLRSGISLPVHGNGGEFGVLSFVAGDNEHAAKGGAIEVLAALSLVRDYALASVLRFLDNAPGEHAPVKLTTRELECLKWAMHGKSSWEISQILRRSEATINFHVANAKKKFNVQTRQQAVIKAIKLGLIVAA